MATRSISIALEARVQGFVSGLRTAQQATNDLGSRIASFAEENEQHLDRVGKAGMVLGGGILAGIGLAVKSFAEFDKAMSEVQASTHESARNMDLLRQAAIDAGADTAFSAKEAAEGINELAKAGVSTKDILAGGLSGALSLAAAGSLGVGEAAEIAASALTQFKLSGKDIPHLADLLAAGAGKAQGSVQDMGAALNQTGLVAASTGLTIEETTGALAAFASAGLTGSDAGTSMKTMLMSLNPNSAAAATLMEELGIKAYDAEGSFIGMSEYAGVLQNALKDMGDEQRNATLKTLFGSDAVRAANVLYEQGAAGIAGWEDAVNDAGFAAQTAAIMQDNLAGDLEKLGGSFDSVLIKGGGGAAEALRGVVQGLEDMVDSVGKIPTPVMNAAVGIAAVTGGVLLLGGGIMTLLPQIVAFRAAQAALATSAPRLAGGITAVGKAAGVAAVAVIALVAANALLGEHDTAPKLEETTQAILKLQKSASAAGEGGLDSLFQKWDSSILKGAPNDVNNLADAVKRLANKDGWDSFNQGAGEMLSMIGGGSAIGQVEDRIKALGDAMGQLTKNGGAETAAESFRHLTKEFEANGKGAKEALESVPGYKEALEGLANTAKVSLTDQELLDFALGKVPASMQAATGATQTFTNAAGEAAPVTEEMAKQLEEVGLSAAGAVTDIAAFAASLFNAGLLSLSASGAAISYQAAIDAMTDSVTKNGTTLDINTEQGRANQSAYNAIAQAAMSAAEATAEETLATQGSAAAQESLQSSLRTSYDDLIRAAGQLGITGDAADTMARKALGIPKEIPIDTWVNDHATGTLDAIKLKADDLDGRRVSMLIETINKTVHQSEYRDDPSMAALNPANHANGGMVNYLAGGGRPRLYDMQPRGTDTIPAMLTPGEIVIRKQSVDSIGAANLLYANQTGQLPPRPAPPRQSGVWESGPTGRTVNANFTINQVDDPIGTSHSVNRRLSALAV